LFQGYNGIFAVFTVNISVSDQSYVIIVEASVAEDFMFLFHLLLYAEVVNLEAP